VKFWRLPAGEPRNLPTARSGTRGAAIVRELVSYNGHIRPVWDVSISPCQNYICTASSDTTSKIFAFEHLQPLRILAGHSLDVEIARFHPNSNYVLTSSLDKTIRMWDLQRGMGVRTIPVGEAVSSLCVCWDGRHALVGCK
jgi:WD40 repeat protein